MFEILLILLLLWMSSTTVIVGMLTMVALSKMDETPYECQHRSNCKRETEADQL